MAFHDIRLNVNIEQGAVGGARFKTDIFPLASGQEKRNTRWSTTRGYWNIGYGIQTQKDYDELQDFFHAREGMSHSFRFKNWSDYKIARQAMFVTDATANTFQMFKRRTSLVNYDKVIEKPTASGALAWVNSVAQTVVYDATPGPLEVAISTLTGVVTVGVTHAATTGQSVEIECEYDVPVRFDTDEFSLNILLEDAASLPSIPIVEVKGE